MKKREARQVPLPEPNIPNKVPKISQETALPAINTGIAALPAINAGIAALPAINAGIAVLPIPYSQKIRLRMQLSSLTRLDSHELAPLIEQWRQPVGLFMTPAQRAVVEFLEQISTDT